MTFDDFGALIGALVVVTYHYTLTRDFRRTLRRIADATERLAAAVPAASPLVDDDRPHRDEQDR